MKEQITYILCDPLYHVIINKFKIFGATGLSNSGLNNITFSQISYITKLNCMEYAFTDSQLEEIIKNTQIPDIRDNLHSDFSSFIYDEINKKFIIRPYLTAILLDNGMKALPNQNLLYLVPNRRYYCKFQLNNPDNNIIEKDIIGYNIQDKQELLEINMNLLKSDNLIFEIFSENIGDSVIRIKSLEKKYINSLKIPLRFVQYTKGSDIN